MRAGDTWCRTFAVVGYPREVGLGWLEPLLTHPGAVDVAVQVEPVPTAVAAERLRRQRARLEASRRLDADRGRLTDLDAQVAADDAHQLAGRLARGETRLHRVGLYVTVRGPTVQAWRSSAPGCRGCWRRCCWTPTRPPSGPCRVG